MSRMSVLIGIVLTFCGYILYTPMPDGATEPWKQRTVLAGNKIFSTLASLGQFFGYDSKINITRAFIELGTVTGDSEHVVEIQDSVFHGVRVRLYKPTGSKRSSQGLVFFHGGGWVYMRPESYDEFTIDVVKQTGIFVVSVDYRLAPENPYPAAFDDCVAATEYLMENAQEFGVDASRIGIAGDSAGGNIAMAVALKLTKKSEMRLDLPKIRLLGLIYPGLQALDFRTPSYMQYGIEGSPCALSKTTIVSFWLWYAQGDLRNLHDFEENRHVTSAIKSSVFTSYVSHSFLPEQYRGITDELSKQEITGMPLPDRTIDRFIDPYFAPLMASDVDLKQFPQTYIMTAEYDIFRDDGHMAAKRLENNGVEVVHSHWPSVGHGFLVQYGFVNLESTKAARLEFSEYLKKKL
ncbi:hypothetical protein ScPMuIL_017545 [Solemya velum]